LASNPTLFQRVSTVVIDAGMASAANLAAMQEAGFSYLAVSRSRPPEIPAEGMLVSKETDATTIQVQRLNQDGEVILCCQSSAWARQEAEMRTRRQQHFEEGLEKLAAGLTKPRGTKSYAKVRERLGRLRAKGLSYRWQTSRARLAIQMRVTVAITNDQGERLAIRQTTDPEPFHLEIYRALGLPPKPLQTKRLRV